MSMTGFKDNAFSIKRGTLLAIAVIVACAIVVPYLNLLLPVDHPLHVPDYLVALSGKFLCYAMLAVSLNLVWGYCGILSLGHGAFFEARHTYC